MGEVVELIQSDILSQCPECGSYDWHLIVDGLGLDYTAIIGVICAGCEMRIIWGGVGDGG